MLPMRPITWLDNNFNKSPDFSGVIIMKSFFEKTNIFPIDKGYGFKYKLYSNDELKSFYELNNIEYDYQLIKYGYFKEKYSKRNDISNDNWVKIYLMIQYGRIGRYFIKNMPSDGKELLIKKGFLISNLDNEIVENNNTVIVHGKNNITDTISKYLKSIVNPKYYGVIKK